MALLSVTSAEVSGSLPAINHFETKPAEIITTIFLGLQVADLLNLRLVCRRFRDIIDKDGILKIEEEAQKFLKARLPPGAIDKFYCRKRLSLGFYNSHDVSWDIDLCKLQGIEQNGLWFHIVAADSQESLIHSDTAQTSKIITNNAFRSKEVYYIQTPAVNNEQNSQRVAIFVHCSTAIDFIDIAARGSDPSQWKREYLHFSVRILRFGKFEHGKCPIDILREEDIVANKTLKIAKIIALRGNELLKKLAATKT